LSIPNRSDRLLGDTEPKEDLTPAGKRALAVLAAAVVLSMTTWFSASAVIPQLRAEWNLSDGAAAWLTIAVQLGFVTGAVVSSFLNLTDVVSPRPVFLVGALGAAVVNALLNVADGPALALPLRFLTGFFLAGVYPPAFKLIATWFIKNRGLALGTLAGAISLGSAGPHLVNALGGLDWKTTVLVTSVLTAVGAVLGFSVKQGPFPFPKAVFDPRQARLVFSNRGVRLASVGYFGHMWELFAMWAWILVFFRDSFADEGSPGSAAAYATFGVIGVGALGSWVGGILGDRWGRTKTTTAMLMTSGVCALLIGLLYKSSPWALLVVASIWGFAVIADSAQFSTMVTELADQSYVGTALTLQLSLGFALTVTTIWLIPIVEDLVGWRWAFTLLVPGPVVGIIAMVRLRGLPEAARIAGGRG
jgi:MFS family permease